MYVDGFLLPIAKKHLPKYTKIAKACSKIWREHGAIEYRECVIDDPAPAGMMVPFAKAAGAKKGEAVIFSWVVYKSKAHRDRANAKVMKDPRIQKMSMDKIFDCARMCWAGFKPIVK